MLASSRLQPIICTARLLKSHSHGGVRWERVPHLPQDGSGVVETPWGAKVVWLRDPDGNFLSIVQYA